MRRNILLMTTMPNATAILDPDADNWAPDSWRARPALQLPTYPDAAALDTVLDELRALPPLVTSWEILALKQQLADAQDGKRFLLQGGDCAETFAECSSPVISNRLKVLLQMSVVLVHGLQAAGGPGRTLCRPVRQAAFGGHGNQRRRHLAELSRRHGQWAGIHCRSAHARSAAHDQGARAFGDDDELRALADRWRFRRPASPGVLGPGLGRQGSPLAEEYQQMVDAIGDAVRFMETLSGAQLHNVNRVDFYTSHEALLLPYEEAQTPPGAAPVRAGSTSARTSRGSACARPHSMVRTSNISAASAIRSRSRSGRR